MISIGGEAAMEKTTDAYGHENRKYDALAQRYHTAEEKAEQLQRQKVT